MMAEGGKEEEMELEAGEIVSDSEMTRSGEQRHNNVVVSVEEEENNKEQVGDDDDGIIPQDVLLAAQAAELPRNGNGIKKDESEEDEEEENAEGMFEEDSDPLSDESSEDESDDEEEDVNAADMQHKNSSHIEGAEELEKMVQRATKDGDSDEDEDGAAEEPPRTANEVTDLPPVPEIEAVLEPNQVPHQVGVVSSIMDRKVIVEAVEHEMVLNEGSILWLTEHRKPLGIVDEVFGPVKKPYYVVRYNKAADVPDVASQGVTVGFVQEFASFVLNDPELRKKGYDASGQHDEEISEEEEFSDDEKEEEAKRLRKLAAKQKHEAGLGGDIMGRAGGRGDRGGRHKAGGRNGGRGGRGGGRGRFIRSDSAKMLEVDDTAKARAAGMGHQRSNSLGSPVFSREKGEHHRGQFHPSPDRQNSWNRSPRSDITYSQVPDLRPPMVNYNERQSLPYQSPHHDFVSGIRPIQQQPPHLSPQRSAGPPHWGLSSHGEVHQVQPAPYLGSAVRWPHQPTGDYQHPEGMYQARVNLVPMASYPLPQQMSMYAPPPQPVGTGVFIPPAQYSRNSQGNQMPMQPTQGAGQMQHPGADGRGPAAGQWPVNGPSIVTGIPCYSNAPQPVFLQPGTIRPGMIAPGPNSNVYWTNNPGR